LPPSPPIDVILGILAGLGIVGATAWSIVKVVFRSDERKLQLRQGGGIDIETIKALREEIAALRDTSTQFDLSIEHAVTRLDERVARMEQRAIRPIAAEPEREGLPLRRE
jgi:hypothetical protein